MRTPRSRASVIALATLLVASGRVRADEQTVAQMAKSAQEHLQSVRQSPDAQHAAYPFGHFLKPPPPPPVEADGSPASEAPIVLPPGIQCQGLMNMGGQTVVVMKDGTHRVGESVEGAKIIRITATEVWFLYRTKQFKVPVR